MVADIERAASVMKVAAAAMSDAQPAARAATYHCEQPSAHLRLVSPTQCDQPEPEAVHSAKSTHWYNHSENHSEESVNCNPPIGGDAVACC